MRATLSFLLGWLVFADGALGQPPSKPPETGRISGYIQGHHGRTGAVVIVCDAKTGIPLHSKTWRPFTEGFRQRGDKDGLAVAHVRTEKNGSFEFQNVPAGTYRLLAQSWAGPFLGPFELNGAVIELHGVARSVTVPSAEAEKVSIEPLGTGVLQIDQKFGNSSGLLMLSTEPPLGDPVLGFTGLGEKYLANLIGGNRMPYGRTTIVGLPSGPVHAAVFMPDNVPGFGFGNFDGTSVQVRSFPMVAAWSDGKHDPPEHIARIIAAVRQAAGAERVPNEFLFRLAGVEAGQVKRMEERTKEADPLERYAARMELLGPLDRSVDLAGVGKVRVIDVLAAFGYMELQRAVEAYRGKRSRNGAGGVLPDP